MPVGTLPKSAKALYEKAYKKARDAGDSEEKAAKKAWGALKAAGWKKGKDGKWTKSAAKAEFSLTIQKAYKYEGEMRWKADTSDTDPDSYGDSMTPGLYDDFLDRIKKMEIPPKEHISDFWSGGLPYLSLSHYSDQNGDAVPGAVDALYVDGKFLKSKGIFSDTLLGKACWESIKAELDDPDKNNKVRISIAFLDYKHRHKSNGYTHDRREDDGFCRECLVELIRGEHPGKEFLEGLLIHLALTRVPVNKRTIMEVDKSMATTQKEDAASIVGDELAEQLDELEEEMEGKALVIKSEDDDKETESVMHLISQVSNRVADLEALMEKDKKDEDDEEDDDEDETEDKADLVVALSDAISEPFAVLAQKLDMLIAAQGEAQKPKSRVPERRSISKADLPAAPPPSQSFKKGKVSIEEAVKRSMGIQ